MTKLSRPLSLPLVALAFLALGVVLYAHSWQGSFYFDDVNTLLQHPVVNDPGALLAYWTETGFFKDRFLPLLTFHLNRALHGFDTPGFRLVNLGLHIANALLVLLWAEVLLKQAGHTASRPLAALVAGLFFLHPLQTNAVTYIVQRMELLASCFYLLSLLGLMRFWHSRHWGWLVAAGVAFVGGAWSKPIIWSLPLVGLWYLWVFQKGKGLTLKAGLALGAVALAFALLSQRYFSSLPALWGPGGRYHWGIGENLLTQANAIVQHYLKLLFVPHPGWMALEHEHIIYARWWAYPTVLSLALIGIWIATALRLRKTHPAVSFGLGWYLLVLLPSSSVIPLNDTIVEYRNYLPSAGIWLTLVSGLAAWQQGRAWLKKYLLAAYLVFALVCAGVTYQRNGVLKDDLGIWQDAVAKYPFNPRSRLGLANALDARGEKGEAAYNYWFALGLKPVGEACNNLGNIYAGQSRWPQAIRLYRRAVAIAGKEPERYRFWKNLGAAYMYAGQLQAAEQALQRSLSIQPTPEAALLLAQLYTQTRQPGKSIRPLQQALALAPRAASLYPALARAYLELGQPHQALEALQRGEDAIAGPELAEAFYLMMTAYRALRQPERAREAAELFLRHSDPADPRRRQVTQEISPGL